MSSNTPIGVYTSTTNTLTPPPANLGRAIGLIGHCTSIDVDQVDTYSDSTYGQIYSFTSFSEALSFLGGKSSTGAWRKGSTSGTANAPMDANTNLLRSLDIIYTFNPSAYVKVAVLTGSLVETYTAPVGLTNALSDMAQHSDIEWFIFCNMNPISEGVAHANISVDSTQLVNSPRFYCTGIDFYSLYAQDSIERPLTADALTHWNTFTSPVGLGVNYLGNHTFNFIRSIDDTDPIKEIGGQYGVCVIVAIASLNPIRYDFGGSANPLGNLVYNDKKYLINTAKNSELYNIIDNGWITTIFKNNTYVFSKATTFTSDATYNIYQARGITNYIHKFIVNNLQDTFELSITSILITSLIQRLTAWFSAWEGNLITDSAGITVTRNSLAVDTLDIEVEFSPIFPLNRINLSLVIGGTN